MSEGKHPMGPMRQQFAAQEYWRDAETTQSGGSDGSVSHRGIHRQTQQVDRRRLLTQTVELDVIPRLLAAQRGAPMVGPLVALDRPAPRPVRIPTQDDVLALADLVLEGDPQEATGFVVDLGAKGVQTETLYLDLLAPTARHLGALWEDDVLHFSDVTVGLIRLQQVMRKVSPTLGNDPDIGRRLGKTRPHALLVPLPGVQHSFGLAMVVEFFRKAGWSVWSGSIDTAGDLARMVGDQWFGVVGLSAACIDDLEPMAKAIRRIRRASRNPDVAVMVGGPAFIDDPQLASQLGADGTAIDGRQAVQEAETLLAARIGQC